jgi:hypothetical protein
MDSKNTPKIEEQMKSRRGFIKKTSVVAGVSILPASNVWGVCNVSGVSGGSQSINTTCVVAPFIGGYQPSKWEKLTKFNPSVSDCEALADMLSDVNTTDRFTTEPNALKMEGYYPYVRSLLDKHGIQILGGGRIPPLNVNVGDTMRNQSIVDRKVKHVVAVYLNAVFGFCELEAQFTGNDGLAAFIEHVWGSLHEGNESQTISVLRGSYQNIQKISEVGLKTILRDSNVL